MTACRTFCTIHYTDNNNMHTITMWYFGQNSKDNAHAVFKYIVCN